MSLPTMRAPVLFCMLLLLALGAVQALQGEYIPEQTQAKSVKTGAATELYLADSGRTLHLRVGQSLAVKLVAFDDGGYSWRLHPLQAGDVLREARPKQAVPPAHLKPGLLGWSSTTVYSFAASRPGTEQLLFQHVPPGRLPLFHRRLKTAAFRVIVDSVR